MRFSIRALSFSRSSRYSLAKAAGDAGIPLIEELRILEDYTIVMSVCFMGSFEVVNHIPEEFLDCRIPHRPYNIKASKATALT
jgi:LytS/YehU family sensor histidine kinase